MSVARLWQDPFQTVAQYGIDGWGWLIGRVELSNTIVVGENGRHWKMAGDVEGLQWDIRCCIASGKSRFYLNLLNMA